MATRNLQSVVIDTDTVILLITDHFHTDSQSNTYTIKLIQFQLDSDIKDLSAEWMASIPFSCTVINKKNPFVESHPPIPLLINICDYLLGRSILRLGWVSVPSLALRPCHAMNCLLTNPLGRETYPVILPKLLMQQVTPTCSMDHKNPIKTWITTLSLGAPLFIDPQGLQLWNWLMNINTEILLCSMTGGTTENKVSAVQSISRWLTEEENAHASFSSW